MTRNPPAFDSKASVLRFNVTVYTAETLGPAKNAFSSSSSFKNLLWPECCQKRSADQFSFLVPFEYHLDLTILRGDIAKEQSCNHQGVLVTVVLRYVCFEHGCWFHRPSNLSAYAAVVYRCASLLYCALHMHRSCYLEWPKDALFVGLIQKHL